eukprot:CAMPEP_0185397326 /NCGR_PEP_ID=MMETSP1364-20130426/86545_1 /TAXON_ID=38817 /ORGANISM="Gephyrocapsa oceanica, Strain RCC1303" /LENGTH=108 /DNA_ID=CAMNT_0027999551 /DNA_START=16 /DNA_END=338 /DNA_ORIENTATION=+
MVVITLTSVQLSRGCGRWAPEAARKRAPRKACAQRHARRAAGRAQAAWALPCAETGARAWHRGCLCLPGESAAPGRVAGRRPPQAGAARAGRGPGLLPLPAAAASAAG